MVAEILVGISLAKSAVSGIKSAIDTAKDVNDIAHHLDDLFKGYDQSRRAANQQKEKQKGNKEWRNYLGKKLHDEDEDVSLSAITAEVIEQKQIEEQIAATKRMLNRRFGPDTWDEIIALRKKRIEEFKKQQARQKEMDKIHAKENHDWWASVWKWTWQLTVVALSIMALWGWLSYASKGKIPWIF